MGNGTLFCVCVCLYFPFLYRYIHTVCVHILQITKIKQCIENKSQAGKLDSLPILPEQMKTMTIYPQFLTLNLLLISIIWIDLHEYKSIYFRL